MSMNDLITLIFVIGMLSVAIKYMYNNRIIYRKEMMRREQRETNQRKKRYRKYQREQQRIMLKEEKRKRKEMVREWDSLKNEENDI